MQNDERNGLKRMLWTAASAVLAGLALQTGALLWWAGGVDARMTAAERCTGEMVERIQAVEGRLMSSE